MTKLEKAIKKTIETCLNLSDNESCVILIDENNRTLGEMFLKTALRISEDSILIEIKERDKKHFEPPSIVNTLMNHTNAIVICTAFSLYHSKALKTACHHGARIICLSNLSLEIIQRSLNTDYEFILEKSNRIADLFSIGRIIHLTTPAGTDITFPISRKKAIVNSGVLTEPGMFTALPAGEAFIPPVKGKSEGIVIADGSLGKFGLVKDHIELKVNAGYVRKIIGGEEAFNLRRILKSLGTNGRYIAGIGIGTNPNAIITGDSYEDEKVMGTVHIALGEHALVGKEFQEQCNISVILKKPTLIVDGHLIIKDGKLSI